MNIKELHESVVWEPVRGGIGAQYEHPVAGIIEFFVYERVDKRGVDFELRVGKKSKLLDAQRHINLQEAVTTAYSMAVTYIQSCQDSQYPDAESMLEAVRALEFS